MVWYCVCNLPPESMCGRAVGSIISLIDWVVMATRTPHTPASSSLACPSHFLLQLGVRARLLHGRIDLLLLQPVQACFLPLPCAHVHSALQQTLATLSHAEALSRSLPEGSVGACCGGCFTSSMGRQAVAVSANMHRRRPGNQQPAMQCHARPPYTPTTPIVPAA